MKNSLFSPRLELSAALLDKTPTFDATEKDWVYPQVSLSIHCVTQTVLAHLAALLATNDATSVRSTSSCESQLISVLLLSIW